MMSMREMNSFGKNRETIFEWFRKHVSQGVYNDIIQPMESDYGEYDDITCQTQAFLFPLRRLIEKGMPEEDAYLMNVSFMAEFESIFPRLTAAQYLELKEECKKTGTKIQVALARDLGEILAAESQDSCAEVFYGLDRERQAIAQKVYDDGGLECAVFLLKALQRHNTCPANLSGMSADAIKRLQEALCIGRDCELAVSILFEALYKHLGWNDILMSAHRMASNRMNPAKILWAAIQIDDWSSFRPIYQMMDKKFRFPVQGAVCTEFLICETVAYFKFTTVADQCAGQYFPPPLELDPSKVFPLEELTNGFCQSWQIPFIVAEGKDWDYLMETGGNAVLVLKNWRSGRSFNEAMTDYLHQNVSASFPVGDYYMAVFPDGASVDLRGIFGAEQQEVTKKLREGGFPNCEFK